MVRVRVRVRVMIRVRAKRIFSGCDSSDLTAVLSHV